MSAATPITWTDHTAGGIHALAKHCGESFAIVLTSMPHCIGLYDLRLV